MPEQQNPVARAREVASAMNGEQVTAPLMQGQRVALTVRLGADYPGTVQVWGHVTGATHFLNRISSLEMTGDTEVYDGRLRELMLELAEQHSTATGTARTTLAGVISKLERIQKLDGSPVPDERREL